MEPAPRAAAAAEPAVPAAPGAQPAVPRAVQVTWRGWACLLAAGGLMLLYLLAQGLVMGLLAGIELAAAGDLPADLGAALGDHLRRHSGRFFSLATLLATPLVLLAAAGAAWLATPAAAPHSERRAAVRRFLGLTPPRWLRLLAWVPATAAALAVYELAARAFERPPIPDFMVELWHSAGWPALLAAAVVVGAPLVEEVVFRGFLLPGLAASAGPGFGGRAGAVAASAALWALIHSQYDLFDLSAVFALGLLFGAARLHTGSLAAPLLLHAAVNAVAVAQIYGALG